MHEHLDRVLEQGLGHGRAVGGHRLQPVRRREPPQVLDGERASAAIPVSGQAAVRQAVSAPAGRDSSRPKRGSVICSWRAKNQPSPCRRSSSTRSKPKKLTSGSRKPAKIARFTIVSSLLGVPGPLAGMASTTVFG